MIIVADAAEADLPRILEIEREAISPPWTHGALLSELYSEDSFFAVARSERSALSEGEIQTYHPVTSQAYYDVMGFVILRRMGNEGELLQIAVDKAARRGGFADSLMKAALGFAEESKLVSIFLEVRQGNGAAIALYKKHGFKPVRTRKGYYSDPTEDALVMKRETEGETEGDRVIFL